MVLGRNDRHCRGHPTLARLGLFQSVSFLFRVPGLLSLLLLHRQLCTWGDEIDAGIKEEGALQN